jgi:hypothetical protein
LAIRSPKERPTSQSQTSNIPRPQHPLAAPHRNLRLKTQTHHPLSHCRRNHRAPPLGVPLYGQLKLSEKEKNAKASAAFWRNALTLFSHVLEAVAIIPQADFGADIVQSTEPSRLLLL